MNALHDEPDAIHDVIGIGFGPSNLALAIAVEEHNARAAPERAHPRPVPGAAAALRLAPGHAHRRRHDAGVLPQGPGHDAQPDQRLQLPVLPAGARPAGRLHQPQDALPAADRVPRLLRVGRRPGRAPGRLRRRGRRPSSRYWPRTARSAGSTSSAVPRRPGTHRRAPGPQHLAWPPACEPHLPPGTEPVGPHLAQQRPAAARQAS